MTLGQIMNDDRNRPENRLLAAAPPPAGGRGAPAGVLAGIYYLSFWLRFEGQLGDSELACFRATVGWVVAGETRLVRGLAGVPGVEPLGHVLRSGGPAAGGHRRPADDGDDPIPLGSAARHSPQRVPAGLGHDDRRPRRRPLAVAGSARDALVAVLLGRPGAGADRRRRRHGGLDAADDPPHRPAALRVVGFIDDNPRPGRGRGSRACRWSASANTRGNSSSATRARQILVMQGELAGPQLRRLMDDARGRLRSPRAAQLPAVDRRDA